LNPIHISNTTPVISRQETGPEINIYTRAGPEYPEEGREQLLCESAVDEMIVRFTDYLDRTSDRIKKKINRVDQRIARPGQRVTRARDLGRA